MTRAHARTPILAALAVLAAAILPRACTRRPVAERSVVPSPAAMEHLRPAVVDPDFSAAEPAEVRAALARAFGGSVEATSPSSAVGDFNGDGAPDLAVAVRALPWRVSDLNDGLANWTVQDCAPFDPSSLPAHARPRPLVREEEALVAIVHGVGARGWRDPGARQAYLLKNAGGPEKARPRADAPGLAEADGSSSGGHVLATTRGRERGVVYWTGVRYRYRSDARVGP